MRCRARSSCSVDSAGEGFEAGFGDEGVDEADDELLAVGGEFGELVEVFAEGVFGGTEGSAGGVVDEEVVAGDSEGFYEADEGVGGWGDLAGFVVADAAEPVPILVPSSAWGRPASLRSCRMRSPKGMCGVPWWSWLHPHCGVIWGSCHATRQTMSPGVCRTLTRSVVRCFREDGPMI